MTMTSRERVLRTLEFRAPDRIPLDIWLLPAAAQKYAGPLQELKEAHPCDIVTIAGPFDHGFNPKYYEIGSLTDEWGSVWENIHGGILGEVKHPVLADEEDVETYRPPLEAFRAQWAQHKDELAGRIAQARAEGKFVIGGWISLFERMQYLRGTEELYCDIAMEEDTLFRVLQIAMEFWEQYLDAWLEMDIDGVAFGDDWGSQISLLINPDTWRRVFKPCYQKLIRTIKSRGKKVFFHSDGCIMDIYDDFIEMGVDAINSQIWCMDVEQVAQKLAGRITCWGEISRQSILPHGTPEQVREAADTMKRLFFRQGGLIGQSEINIDVPLENVQALFSSWDQTE